MAAYKRPAYLLLASHHQASTTTNPLPRLCALVAYYPQPADNLDRYTNLTPCETPSADGGPLLPLQIHLSESQSPALYDNYYINPDKKRHRCHVFAYPESRVGFAEPSSFTYDRIDAQLAWSRTLDCVKRGFGPGPSWAVSEIELVWTEYWQNLTKAAAKESHAQDNMELMVSHGDEHGEHDHYRGPSVNCIPTMVRGMPLPLTPTVYTWCIVWTNKQQQATTPTSHEQPSSPAALNPNTSASYPAPSDPTASSTKSCSPSSIPRKSPGCYPASPRQTTACKSRWCSQGASVRVSWRSRMFIGIRRGCWCRLDCWIQGLYLGVAWRRALGKCRLLEESRCRVLLGCD